MYQKNQISMYGLRPLCVGVIEPLGAAVLLEDLHPCVSL